MNRIGLQAVHKFSGTNSHRSLKNYSPFLHVLTPAALGTQIVASVEMSFVTLLVAVDHPSASGAVTATTLLIGRMWKLQLFLLNKFKVKLKERREFFK